MKRFCIMLAAAMLAGLLAACGAAPQSAAPAESTSLPAAMTGQPLRRLESGDADAYYQVRDAGDGTHTILYRIDLVTGACAPVCTRLKRDGRYRFWMRVPCFPVI